MKLNFHMFSQLTPLAPSAGGQNRSCADHGAFAREGHWRKNSDFYQPNLRLVGEYDSARKQIGDDFMASQEWQVFSKNAPYRGPGKMRVTLKIEFVLVSIIKF